MTRRTLWQSPGPKSRGVVSALDNGIGVVGVAPGARLWAVEVFRNNLATLSSVLCGIDWVLAHADTIEIVNMSFGGPGPDDDSCGGRISGDPFHQAICALVDAGVTVVASAGNEAIDASAFTPAGFEDVIACPRWWTMTALPADSASRRPVGSRRSPLR